VTLNRLLFLIHRYLGIALSLAVLAWCLSGLVMMYVQYPELTETERAAGLAELSLADCCVWPDDFSDIDIDRFSVEMLAGRPVARLASTFGEYTLDIGGGGYLDYFDADQARAIAADASHRLGLGDRVSYLGEIERDQWTISGYDAHLPLHLFAADDPRGTEFYVSSTTGALVQMTTSIERIGSWLGSVVHWFYPTVIRQHVEAWSQTIIWTSLLGLFLTVIGLYIGIKQLKFRRSGRLSPYRGMALWHHYGGLLFGFLTLTWLFSGLLSMNPWDTFVSRSFAPEAARVQGRSLTLRDAQSALAGVVSAQLPPGTVRLVGEPFDGRVYFTAWNRFGERTRLDGTTLRSHPLADAELAELASRLRPGEPIAEQGWLDADDAYYFSHHTERPLPVYRIIYDDRERLYLDGTSGQLAYAVDASRRGSRWLFSALHRGDFAAVIRQRPLWDVMMWVLMIGVTVGAATGTWMGIERIARALRRMAHRRSGTAAGSS
jgi:hypothetical protein